MFTLRDRPREVCPGCQRYLNICCCHLTPEGKVRVQAWLDSREGYGMTRVNPNYYTHVTGGGGTGIRIVDIPPEVWAQYEKHIDADCFWQGAIRLLDEEHVNEGHV